MTFPMINQTVAIALGIVMIFSVFAVIGHLKNEYGKFAEENEARAVCKSVKNTIELYSYESYSNTTTGYIIIDLPEKIAGGPYDIFTSGRTITVNGNNVTSCNVTQSIAMSGKTSGGRTWIETFSNNTAKIGKVI
ncbi:MAG: hypothetical protein J4473_05440 [Candidatus Aenigmarchaeota archaeon]|nr:hypothetical protein [Candidatus Aenigmarchaeota archaeon]